MFISVHAAIGVAAVTTLGIKNPVVGFGFGWLLHYLGDAIPHGDENFGKWISSGRRRVLKMAVVFGIDFLIWLICLVGVNWRHELNSVQIAAAIGALVPDVWMGVELLQNKKKFSLLTRFHFASHKLFELIFPLYYGLPLQIILGAAMWWLVIQR